MAGERRASERGRPEVETVTLPAIMHPTVRCPGLTARGRRRCARQARVPSRAVVGQPSPLGSEKGPQAVVGG